MVLRKALSASQATINNQQQFASLGRVYLRVFYDTVTHVLAITVIQSNKLQRSERQKLYPRIRFNLFLYNGETQSNVYKTHFQSNLDLIDIKETFYFPNIVQSKLQSTLIFEFLFISGII